MKKKGLIISGILIICFAILAFNLKNPTIIEIDKSVSNFILMNQNQNWVNFSSLIGVFFDIVPIIMLTLIVALMLFIKSRPKEALYFASSSMVAGGLIYILKELISRPRPILQAVKETSFAFPSGHATISVVFFGFLIFLSLKHMKTKTQKILAVSTGILMILLAGFTRIYLNVHWLTDVIGGYLLGAAIIIPFCCFYKKH